MSAAHVFNSAPQSTNAFSLQINMNTEIFEQTQIALVLCYVCIIEYIKKQK